MTRRKKSKPSHFLAESSDVSGGLDHPLAAVVMLIEFLPEGVEHGHEWVVSAGSWGLSSRYLVPACIVIVRLFVPVSRVVARPLVLVGHLCRRSKLTFELGMGHGTRALI